MDGRGVLILYLASAKYKINIYEFFILTTYLVAKKEEIGSPHWKMFRYISVIMIGVYPAAILAPTPVIDWAITIFFPLHSYWLVVNACII
jgi:hypothetical protein